MADGAKPAWDAAQRAVTWRGRSNRYHVSPGGSAWARAATAEPLAEAPTTLDAWSQGGREAGARTEAIRFAPSSPASPALVGVDGESVGASPEQVGPRS